MSEAFLLEVNKPTQGVRDPAQRALLQMGPFPLFELGATVYAFLLLPSSYHEATPTGGSIIYSLKAKVTYRARSKYHFPSLRFTLQYNRGSAICMSHRVTPCYINFTSRQGRLGGVGRSFDEWGQLPLNPS